MKNGAVTKIIVLLLCLAAVTGCGGGAEYADDVAVSDIAEKVDAAIGMDDGSMIAVEESYINGTMKMDVSEVADYVVKINAYGANVNEYGIFKSDGKDGVKELETAVSDYLQMRNDTWMTEYMPEERPKMEAASYVTFGNYVMYAVLDDDVKQSAFSALETALKNG